MHHEVLIEEMVDLPDGRIVCRKCLPKIKSGEIVLEEIPEDEIPEDLQDELTTLSLDLLSRPGKPTRQGLMPGTRMCQNGTQGGRS